jgi:hypothetical protein
MSSYNAGPHPYRTLEPAYYSEENRWQIMLEDLLYVFNRIPLDNWKRYEIYDGDRTKEEVSVKIDNVNIDIMKGFRIELYLNYTQVQLSDSERENVEKIYEKVQAHLSQRLKRDKQNKIKELSEKIIKERGPK